MDLHKLSLGLAALKDGLDELDRLCTAEAAAGMALRQAASASQQQRAGLLKQVAATQAQVFTAQDESDDLHALLECLRGQLAATEGARTALQDEVAALEAEAARFVDGFEAQCDAFSDAFAPGRLVQQQADIKAEAAAAEASVRGALQAYRAERRALLAQQAAVKELRQEAADRHAALVEVKQQVAAESAMASTLAAQLLEAQQQGPAARQLVQLQASVAEREAGVLNQQCSVARQEVELGRLQMEVKHRHQDMARKTARLEELNRTVHALGLPPVATSAGAYGFPAAGPQHRPGATTHMQPAAASAAPQPQQQQLPYVVEEPPSDDDDAPHVPGAGDQGMPAGGHGPVPAALRQPPPATHDAPPPPPPPTAPAAGSSAPRGRRVLMQETVVLHSVQGAQPAAAQAHVVQTRHVVVQQEVLGGGRGPAGDGVKRHSIILQSETTTTTTTTATAAAATHRGSLINTHRPPPPLLLLPAAHAAPEVQPSPSVGHGGGGQLKGKGGGSSRPRAAAKSAAAKSKAKAPARRRKSTAQKQPPAQCSAGDDDMFGKGENY